MAVGGTLLNTPSEVITEQRTHETFSDLPIETQGGIVANFAGYLLGGYDKGQISYDGFESKISEMNTLVKKYNITIENKSMGSPPNLKVYATEPKTRVLHTFTATSQDDPHQI